MAVADTDAMIGAAVASGFVMTLMDGYPVETAVGVALVLAIGMLAARWAIRALGVVRTPPTG